MAGATPARAGPRSLPVTWDRVAVDAAPHSYTTWPATPRAVGAARADVVRAAREAGASTGLQGDIALAISEACTNAVRHAYASPGIRGVAFRVSTIVRRGIFHVWVGDDGRGAAHEEPDALGLGLGVMAGTSAKLVLGRLDDGSTQVELQFALTAS